MENGGATIFIASHGVICSTCTTLKSSWHDDILFLDWSWGRSETSDLEGGVVLSAMVTAVCVQKCSRRRWNVKFHSTLQSLNKNGTSISYFQLRFFTSIFHRVATSIFEVATNRQKSKFL
jgi:hypothetical protein